jgi:hypothetical protein
MIDTLLTDLSVANWATSGTRIVDLRGTNQPRTSASNAAVALLVSKGVTVITN